MKNALFTLLLFLTSCTSQEGEAPKNLTGTWETPAKVPYIIQYSKERPQGRPITLNGIKFVERQVKIKWMLNQTPNGLISGTNTYIIFDEKGEVVMEAIEPMVGVVNGKRIALIEGKKTDSPQVHFDCTAEGPNQLNCFGFDVGGIRPFAIHFKLNKTKE